MDQRDHWYAEESLPAGPLSLLSGMLVTVVGAALLAAIIWLGHVVGSSNEASGPIRIDDPTRSLIFLVDPATSDVRVLNVRGGISEVARLHASQRHSVTGLTLDASRRWLSVRADDASYVYDTSNFRLQRRDAMGAQKVATEHLSAANE